MITRDDLKRYMQDRHALRREQVILPNGSLYGEVEEPWQREHIWEPLDARDGVSGSGPEGRGASPLGGAPHLDAEG